MALGPNPQLAELAENLNPVLFRLLVRDLLGESGFTDVQDVDGSGDGGRDLQGRARDGIMWVFQLKHRQNPAKATGANEFAELPMALRRFGLTHGRFITNGRLTAPAKRDCISAFPGCEMDFWEGVDVLAAYSNSVLTRLLWGQDALMYSGNRVAKFGFTTRLVEEDRAVTCGPDVVNAFASHLEAGGLELAMLNITFGKGVYEYTDFSPFRPAIGMPINEGKMSAMVLPEVQVRGAWTVDQLPTIQNAIGRALGLLQGTAYDAECAVRVGRPVVSVGLGSSDEAAVQMRDLRAATFCSRGTQVLSEHQAFKRELGLWNEPTFIQVVQEAQGGFRLLNDASEMMVELKVRSPVSRAELGFAIEQRERFDRWWSRSVSVWARKPIQTDTEGSTDPLAPHFCFRWTDKTFLITWLHPRLQGGVGPPVLWGDERDEGQFPLTESEAEAQYVALVEEQVAQMKFQRIGHRRAYHAHCFVQDGEPVPALMSREYTTGMLLEMPEQVPSPIDTWSCELVFSAAYLVPSGLNSGEMGAVLSDLSFAGWNVSMERPEGYGARTIEQRQSRPMMVFRCHRVSVLRMRLKDRIRIEGAQAAKIMEAIESKVGLCRAQRSSRAWMREEWRVLYGAEGVGVVDFRL